jgi:hypothetical protein
MVLRDIKAGTRVMARSLAEQNADIQLVWIPTAHAAAASKSCFLNPAYTMRIRPGGYSCAHANAGRAVEPRVEFFLARKQDGHSVVIDGCYRFVRRGGEKRETSRSIFGPLLLDGPAGSGAKSRGRRTSHAHLSRCGRVSCGQGPNLMFTRCRHK